MSNYTTELRFVCETFAGMDESAGYDSINTIIAKARPRIFNFSYPIFDTAYKPTLETKIIKHYYTRELCAETYARWKLFLDARLNEIMPKYNQLYESELIKFNPLYDTDYRKEGDRNTDTTLDDVQKTTTDMTNLQTDNRKSVTALGGTDVSINHTELGGEDVTTANSEDGGTERVHRENVPVVDQWTYYNDTPQGGVDGMHLSDNNYLTTATHVTSTGEGSEDDSTTTFGRTNDTETTTEYGRTSDSRDTTNYGRTSTTNDTGTTKRDTDGTITADRDSTSNTLEDYAEHVFGKMPGKSYSKLLQEFRDTFLNIDLMIIRELSDLFFGLWE